MYTPKDKSGYITNEITIKEEQYFGFFKYELPGGTTVIRFDRDAETRDEGLKHAYGNQYKAYKGAWKADDVWRDILAEKINSDNFKGK